MSQCCQCPDHVISGGLIWLTALTIQGDQKEVLQQGYPQSTTACTYVGDVDLEKGQYEDPDISRVLEFLKANQRSSVLQKRQETPSARKLLNEWHKLHIDKKSGILYRNQRVVLPLKFKRMSIS